MGSRWHTIPVCSGYGGAAATDDCERVRRSRDSPGGPSENCYAVPRMVSGRPVDCFYPDRGWQATTDEDEAGWRPDSGGPGTCHSRSDHVLHDSVVSLRG